MKVLKLHRYVCDTICAVLNIVVSKLGHARGRFVLVVWFLDLDAILLLDPLFPSLRISRSVDACQQRVSELHH